MKTNTAREERRLYTRLKKRIPVSIYYNNHEVARCVTHDICIGGARLDLQDSGLTHNALIEITFGVNQWHALHRIRLPSIVVWRNDAQISVAFEMIRKDIEDLMQDSMDCFIPAHDAPVSLQ